MSLIKESRHHFSACLPTTSTRCQNRSSPFCLRPKAGNCPPRRLSALTSDCKINNSSLFHQNCMTKFLLFVLESLIFRRNYRLFTIHLMRPPLHLFFFHLLVSKQITNFVLYCKCDSILQSKSFWSNIKKTKE